MKKIVLCMLLISLVLLCSCGQKTNFGKGTPYSGSYELQKDGTVLFTIKDDLSDEYEWNAVSGDEKTVQIKPTGKRDESKAAFSLSGVAPGVAEITVSYEKEGLLTDQLCEVTFNALVEEDLSVGVDSLEHVTLDGVISGGGDSGVSYSYMQKASVVEVAFSGDQQGWKARWNEKMVSVEGPVGSKEGSVFTIEGLKEGKTKVCIENADAGKQLVLNLKMTKKEVLSVTGESLEDYRLPALETTEFAPAEAVAGEIRLPESARATECKTISFMDNGTQDVAVIDVSFEGISWSCWVSKKVTQAAMSSEVAGFGGQAQTVSANGTTATIYSFSDGTAAFWTANGQSCGLFGETMEAEKAAERIKSFLEGIK